MLFDYLLKMTANETHTSKRKKDICDNHKKDNNQAGNKNCLMFVINHILINLLDKKTND